MMIKKLIEEKKKDKDFAEAYELEGRKLETAVALYHTREEVGMIRKYRKRPVEVEAIQFDGWNWREVYQFMSDEPLAFTDDFRKEEYLLIDTLEGVMKARVDDYIIKGVHGEFYPCKPDIFHETYEELAE